ncbi:oxidoreductase [Echinicola pacifica]|uniref:Oxidoreductase n=1 Tax=Echinicola pacifica TaxID=346377 RepID=A0A918PNK6_9BACT|nr:Gfo/Idh/MocA family oxidoreductase [Echinicola pacifica]GGZ15834.1 oxidoreductase [Echinicola pacifica]
MSKIFTIGIVGTGAIARQHAKAIHDLPNAQLVAVCSSDAQRASAAEQDFGVKAYHEMSEFLNHPHLDMIIVCTASGHHMEPSIAAAQAGIHVLIEKPIEISTERAKMIVESCEDNSVKLGVIFQNRLNEGFQTLLSELEKGSLGRLLMGNAHINWFRKKEYYTSSPWKGTLKGDGGGAFINQGIHTIDLLLAIMGAPRSVFGKVKTTLHPIEGEDIGAAVVEFDNGAMGNITASTALYPGYPERLEIFGSEGSAILEGGKLIAFHSKISSLNIGYSSAESQKGTSDPMAIGHLLHQEQISEFLSAIENNTVPKIDGREGMKSLRLIEAIYESSKKGSTIDLN